MDRVRVEAHQAGQAEQGDEGRKQGQEPVVGQGGRGHAAPVGDELLRGPLQRVLPARSAELERVIRAARHLVRRGYRLVRRLGLRLLAGAGLLVRAPAVSGVQPRHVLRRLQTTREAMITRARGGRGERPAALHRLVLPQLPGHLGRLALHLGGLVLRHGLHLRGLVLRLALHLGGLGLGPGLHVGLGGQFFHGLAETLSGPLDLLLNFRCGLWCGHRCVLSLISSTSALTSATACSGSGGAARCMRFRPRSATPAAAASKTTPTISAASQAATTPLMAMIAHASRQPTP